MQALLAGELDFLDRLSSADYFGERTASESFSSRFYTGYFFTPYMGYTAWNVKRPHLADARVRLALGCASTGRPTSAASTTAWPSA